MAAFRRNRLGAHGSGGKFSGEVDPLDIYVQDILSAFQQFNGDQFADCLSLRDEHADRLLLTSLCHSDRESSPEPADLLQLSDELPTEYLNLIACHLKCLFYLNREDLLMALQYQEEMSKVVASSLPKLKNEDVSWYLSTITVVARDLSSLALKVHQLQNHVVLPQEGQVTPIDRAFNSIQQLVRTCAAEKGASEEHSKKRALVPLVNQLFRLCFRTGRANLCKPLVRTIDNLKILDRCPASQVVTYFYFAGKLAVVEGDYVLAEQKLTLAYQRCSPKFASNMKSILRLLVPLRLRLDIKPSAKLLTEYDLYQYQDIVRALQSADVTLFHQSKDRFEGDFIRWSIFYLIDNLRLVMFRHVFRKLLAALNHHIVAITDVTVALKVAGYKTPVGEDPSDADAECIIVNLIGEDLVKAYVSWQLKKIVVAKTVRLGRSLTSSVKRHISTLTVSVQYLSGVSNQPPTSKPTELTKFSDRYWRDCESPTLAIPDIASRRDSASSAGKLEKHHQSFERLVEVELHHPVEHDVFALEYDRKIGPHDQQTENYPLEDCYPLEELGSSAVSSGTSSPTPSESASLTGSNRDSSSTDIVGVMRVAAAATTDLTVAAQDLSASLSMTDGHLGDTSGYASNNSSKDNDDDDDEGEAHAAGSSVGSFDTGSSVAGASSLRSASPVEESVSSPLPASVAETQSESPLPVETSPEPASVVGVVPVVNQSVRKCPDASHAPPLPAVRVRVDETPIERDIRIAAMREEELRLQQGVGSPSNRPAELEKHKPITPKRIILSHLPGEQAHYSNTQRVLATTRLQQEIEEQKRRELDLKRAGRVQSISEERTDDESVLNDEHDSVATQLSGSSSSTADPVLPKATIKQQRAFFENPSQTLPEKEHHPSPNFSVKPIKATPTSPAVQKTQVAVVAVQKTQATTVPARLMATPSSNMRIPMTMERFISSRGKSVNAASSSSPLSPLSGGGFGAFSNGTAAQHDSYVDYSALRVVPSSSVPVTETEADREVTVKKVYRSAKLKISDELKEMEKREAELRETRAILGLAVEAETDTATEHNQQTATVKEAEHIRTEDIILESSQIPKGRQSLLRAQWEARSQQ
ncbi:putative PCI domain-containing protein 2-like protein [Hypsibius exemplaris]|uniref:PCI domain-containing protein 2-like protein n=1 Tax=Hypsibius exemplaris TaxID=2072580 RepID=A0A1W0X5M4_HYPEX|nr:putative PCI domain-containing protein 2-like protein [Hypsibius exemplaris]